MTRFGSWGPISVFGRVRFGVKTRKEQDVVMVKERPIISTEVYLSYLKTQFLVRLLKDENNQKLWGDGRNILPWLLYLKTFSTKSKDWKISIKFESVIVVFYNKQTDTKNRRMTDGWRDGEKIHEPSCVRVCVWGPFKLTFVETMGTFFMTEFGRYRIDL